MSGHHQHHHHHHVDPETGDARVLWAILVNMALTVAQAVGGVFAGSLALIADALHNFSDVIALIIAFGARKIARRPADNAMTFGYGRIEVVAALINYTTLIILGLYLLCEAVLRFFDPQPVDGWLIVIIAGLALGVDVVTAALTFRLSKSSMNIRAAFLHNLTDALGSFAVILAGTLILLYDWRLVDPLVTLLIAGYILWQSLAEIGSAIRILMLASPPGLDVDQIIARIEGLTGLQGVHHLHLWQMQEHETALDCHLVIEKGHWPEADAVKSRVRDLLRAEFGISHSTLEMECAKHACAEYSVIGHGQGN